ncbi:MAG: hypothetical protein ACOZD0_09105 [Pseudomonadota bacterium]
MSSVIVGVFDSDAEARAARMDLLQQGFAPADVHLSEDAGDARSREERTQDAVARSESVSGAIGGLLRSLFQTGGPSADEQLYAEAARRGHVVLVVEAADEQREQAATAALARSGAWDIEARASQWWPGQAARAGGERRDAARVYRRG